MVRLATLPEAGGANGRFVAGGSGGPMTEPFGVLLISQPLRPGMTEAAPSHTPVAGDDNAHTVRTHHADRVR
ncbi:hypothetical protein GCM10022282_01660 [Agromyces indicus]